MKTFSIGLETMDRRLVGQKNYLGETLTNLRRAGVFDSPQLVSFTIVCSDALPDFFAAEAEPFLDGVRFAYVDEKCTRQQNGARAIRLAAAAKCDWVMKLEDDVDFIADFLGSTGRWLDDQSHQDVCMFTLAETMTACSAAHYDEPGESILGPGKAFPAIRKQIAEGYRAVLKNMGHFWGAQAIVFRPATARKLAKWLGPDPFYPNPNEEIRHRGHDLILHLWADTLPNPFFCAPVPSFVQHIGRQSTMNNIWFEFPWPGREWSYQRERVTA